MAKMMDYGPVVRLTILSLLVCGLFFPLLITGLAQVLMPFQANGDIVHLHGRPVGSSLIAQEFISPIFFHPRNDSASGVDPHITLADAYSQIPRIHAATGIPSGTLMQLVESQVERTFWIYGDPYVNVLNLNLRLIEDHPAEYGTFVG